MGLKIPGSQGRSGSSPEGGTKHNLVDMAAISPPALIR